MVCAASLVFVMLAASMCQAEPADYRVELLGAKLLTDMGHFTEESYLGVIDNKDSVRVLTGRLEFNEPFPGNMTLEFVGNAYQKPGGKYANKFRAEQLFCEFLTENQDGLKTMFVDADFSECPPKKGTVWLLANSTIDMRLLPETAPEDEWDLFIEGHGDYENLLSIVISVQTMKI